MSKNKGKRIKSRLSDENQINEKEFDNKPTPGSPTLSLTSSLSSSSSSSSSTTSQPPPPIPLPRQKSLQQQFVEEIDYNEIETEEVVGKGSFGVVWKGKWRGRDVAIKHINTEGERRAFTIEVRQLSRVSHPNIVRLYGACTKNPVCLVMEYAEGGSLYNVLHCEPKPRYTAGHAMSWALQCAQGVAYLHNMKPKPLIHRDLKPPNLLLILGGRTLKICDFGTACDLNTYMTNNKGSAAWMAPEVFEGSRYTEKCDIFSWGVILWEVLTRHKPFDDIGGSAYRIMWAVHNGQRPPLIEGCPKPIENLITRCWTKIPEERPAMNEIVRVMTHLSDFFSEHLEPLEYPQSTSEIYHEDEALIDDDDTMDITWNTSSQINSEPVTNWVDNCGKQLEHSQPSQRKQQPGALNMDEKSCGSTREMSRPPLPPIPAARTKNLASNDNFQPLHIDCDPNAWDLATSTDSSWEIQNMAGLDVMGPKNKKTIDRSSTNNDHLENVYRLLDAELRPLTPDNTCQLSKEIFEEHKQLAEEYLKVQTEIALVGGQYTNELLKSSNVNEFRQQQELRKLAEEKNSLLQLYCNLKRQLELMNGQRRPGTVLNSSENLAANNSAIPGHDGWVCVPRQEHSRIS
ncbi:hypothetical protein PV328_004480 [Microctonus aethiopoides]|uniref:Mitogen-activated protein kinase kinase kinase 7 n=1 Tax=Microctonus aethiopoides TaxID=144406 RepID=A0AA39FAV7_9HYME|nr:hypothetical protein PV328_004480 [Microctonus aethiopoides]